MKKKKWTDAIQEIEGEILDPREDGWMTFEEVRQEMCQDESIGINRCHKLLAKLIKQGRAATKELYFKNAAGRRQKRPYYRLVD